MDTHIIANKEEDKKETKPKSKFSALKITGLLIAFFSLVLLAGSAIFNVSIKKNITTQTSTPAPEPTGEPTAISEENKTAAENQGFPGWKTYFTDYYQFYYPPDMKLIEDEEGRVAITKWGPTQKAETEFFDGISLTFTPYMDSVIQLDSFVQSQIDEFSVSGLSEVISGPSPIVLNDYQGLTYTIQGLGTHNIIIVQSKDGSALLEIVNSSVDPGNLGFKEIVDQILSTFKFINEKDGSFSPDSPSVKSVQKCIVSGCNNEICAAEEGISTCVYKPEYGCYALTKCEVQENGKCGWTQTEELIQCLESAM